MHISDQDRARIAQAISDAESRTSGEILCVLTHERHRYVEWIVAVAAIGAFVLPWLATLLGFGPERWTALVGLWRQSSLNELQTIETYAAVQAILFLLIILAMWWSPLAQRLAPEPLRRARLHEIALQQFLTHGIHMTAGRTGVLIFVSVEDHMAEIIADTGIYAKVPPEHWADTIQALLAGLKQDQPAQGFIDAIALAGEVLATHFPPLDENPNEIENHLIIV